VADHRWLRRSGRRSFLGQVVRGSVGVTAGWALPRVARAQATPDVVIGRGGEVRDRLAAVLKPLGGVERFVRAGATVVIKPNAAFSEPPETGGNTTPEVAAAVVHACKAAGAGKVIVTEGCCSNRGLFATTADPTGVTQAAQAEGAEVIDPSGNAANYREVRLDAPDCQTHPINRLILEADLVINLPRLKTHPGTGYTMSIKNLMGVMRQPGVFHKDGWKKLPERLSCLGRALQPHIALTIIDATDLVEGWAAGHPGKLTRLNVLIAGTNMATADAIGLTFFGKNPLSDWQCAAGDNYLRLAHQAGWGKADLREINFRQVGL
jgi:uncharacterized protein (DUF362 family)